MKDTKNIMILGGYGRTGLEIAKLLLRESKHNIGLGGRDLLKATRAARDLNWKHSGERVRGVEVNVVFKKQLTAVLGDYDLVIVSIPVTAFRGQIARAALDASLDFIDLNADDQRRLHLKELDVEIRAAGLTFITEAGFVPGTPSLIARYLAGYFDSLETVNMGALFGREPGPRSCYPMGLAELCGLPEKLGCRELGFYGSGMNRFAELTRRMWKTSRFRRTLNGNGRSAWPGQVCTVNVTATGTMYGHREKLELTLKHRNPYRTTAIAAVPCVLGVLDGSLKLPGVHVMGHVLDTEQYMDDLWRMGMTVSLQGLPDTWDEECRANETRADEILKDDIGLIGQIA